MDSVECVLAISVEIHCARAQRIIRAGWYSIGDSRCLASHIVGWIPGWPFGLAGDGRHAFPSIAGLADSDGVAPRFAVSLNVVELARAGIDDDGTACLRGRIVDGADGEIGRKPSPVDQAHRELFAGKL